MLVRQKSRVPTFGAPIAFALLVLSFGFGAPLSAQLDTQHWIPPFFHATDSPLEIGSHTVVVSTLSPTPVSFTITDAAGNLVAADLVSATDPVIACVGDLVGGAYTPLAAHSGNIVTGTTPAAAVLNLNTPNLDGLIVSAEAPVFVNVRHRSDNHGASWTGKGAAALGDEFRVGVLRDAANPPTVAERRAVFLSVMATVDGTSIVIDDIDPDLVFSGTNPADYPIEVTVDALESYVVAIVANETTGTAPFHALNGTRVRSLDPLKPIAVTSGSWTGGPSGVDRDIGIDQLTPVDRAGTEFILQQGNANNTSTLETPTIVALEPDTQVFVNGSAKPFTPAPLQPGDFVFINEQFSPEGNLYIQTSAPTLCFQTLGGSNSPVSPGLNFVPPLGVDSGVTQAVIPQAGLTGNAEIGVVAPAAAVVTVTVDGVSVTTPTASPVPGTTEWVTYSFDQGLPTDNEFVCGGVPTGNVEVTSDVGPIAVQLVTISSIAGTAGYFTGFAGADAATCAVTPAAIDAPGVVTLEVSIPGNPLATDPVNLSIFSDPTGFVAAVDPAIITGVDLQVGGIFTFDVSLDCPVGVVGETTVDLVVLADIDEVCTATVSVTCPADVVVDNQPPTCEVSPRIGSAFGVSRDNRPSEDQNGDGVLQPKEDTNGNGVIDADSGVAAVELVAGATNLQLTVAAFTPGDPEVTWTATLINTALPGSGMVRTVDVAGNEVFCDVALEAVGDDCNGNGVTDSEDIAAGTSPDCDGNGTPDECDLDPADPDGDGMVAADCNGNGVPDSCDLDRTDPDGDGETSADCNANGIPDSCDIATGDPDCDQNGIPDSCDLDPSDPDGDGQVAEDCNDNGAPDSCDIDDGTSSDSDGDGIPDECSGPPVAICNDLTLALGVDCCATVFATELAGASFDPDGPSDPLSFCITAVDGRVIGCLESVELCGPGSRTLTVAVTDSTGLTESCEATVTLVGGDAPELQLAVEVIPEERGKFGVDSAAFRVLGASWLGDCAEAGTIVSIDLLGIPVEAGDELRLELDDEFEIDEPGDDDDDDGDDDDDEGDDEGDDEDDDDSWDLRLEAPQFIFTVHAIDPAGNPVTLVAALTIEDFAGAELDVDEVEPGTERGRGIPLPGAVLEFADHVADLLDDGFSNPPGIPSVLAP